MGMTEEPRDVRLRRMRMRSWRRGTKEMDLILGAFADRGLATLDDAALDLYDLLLEENDHDLYAWVAGRASPPSPYADLLARIAAETTAGA
jgi:antitoxin CptB